jgi:hypothetical protein
VNIRFARHRVRTSTRTSSSLNPSIAPASRSGSVGPPMDI